MNSLIAPDIATTTGWKYWLRFSSEESRRAFVQEASTHGFYRATESYYGSWDVPFELGITHTESPEAINDMLADLASHHAGVYDTSEQIIF